MGFIMQNILKTNDQLEKEKSEKEQLESQMKDIEFLMRTENLSYDAAMKVVQEIDIKRKNKGWLSIHLNNLLIKQKEGESK